MFLAEVEGGNPGPRSLSDFPMGYAFHGIFLFIIPKTVRKHADIVLNGKTYDTILYIFHNFNYS